MTNLASLVGRATVSGATAGLSARRLAQTLRQSQYGGPGPIDQTAPNADPQQQTAASLLSFNNTARTVEGVVTDTTAIANCYRVQFEKARHPSVCVLSSYSSIQASGARSLATLQPGTRVTVVVSEMLPWGIIIGATPMPGTEGKLSLHQIISMSSRQRVDEAHKKPIKMHSGGYIPDWLSGRPFDATTAGEQGWIAETGMRIFMDSFMAQIGVDEATMLTCFYHDQLMRLAAYNFQHWTAGMEREAFDDQGEYNDVIGYTPFPWENIGLWEPGDPRRELKPEEWQNSQPFYAKWEPLDDYMMPWHREKEFHGYLGQGGKRMVTTRPIDFERHSSYEGGAGIVGPEFPNLFDEFRGIDGRYCLASAKGIALVKRMGGAHPSRLRRPEQKPEGDNPENYKHAGLHGDGPEHRITGDIEANGPHPQLQRALGVMDFHAYFFNYAGLHPFFYHSKDWKIQQEEELQWTQGQSFKISEMKFPNLASSMYLKPPEPITLDIDHRYGAQDFYQTESGIQWLEDGGMVIYDGFGSEIRMTAGSVFISAPGDVWTKSGRNCNVWAGYDYIMRAKHSSDMTVTEKDMRFKAEYNMQLLAGNSGLGNMMLESRAKAPIYDFSRCGEDVFAGGIILKARNSEVISWARNIYLRTGGGNVDEGVICLDASRGKHDITTHARYINNFLREAEFHFFGEDGSIDLANEFSRYFCTIGTGACINGINIINGDVVNKGWTISPAGHIATEFAPQFAFLVPPLTGEGLRRAYEAVAKCEERATATLPSIGEGIYAVELEQLWYAGQRPGSDDVMTDGEFSLRELEHYRTEDFKLYEDRWQQLARMSEQVGPTWTEKPVDCKGRDLWPYPGKEKYEEPTYYQQDMTIYEFPEGRAKNRGEAGNLAPEYAEPKFDNAEPVKLDGNYPTIR